MSPHIPMDPCSFLAPQLQELIRATAAAAEKTRTLHPQQLEIIYEQNWFNLFVPKEYGGLQLNLVEALQTEEAIACADGSMGWTVTLCAGANWFIGFLAPEKAKQLFADSHVCFAGSGRPSGVAKRVNGGYQVSGLWSYATGAPHATIFTANCLIEDNGDLVRQNNGDALIRSFWFKRREVLIHQDWNCMGMKATGSHSFEIKQLQVPGNRCFIIDHAHRFHKNAVYQFPFLQFAEATLAVNISGMAARFIELAKQVFLKRRRHYAVQLNDNSLHQLAFATKRLYEERQTFYSTVEWSWNALMTKEKIEQGNLDKLTGSSKALAKISRQLVADLYPFCGMLAANPDTEINRVWRNMNTASQHSLFL